MAPFCTPKTMSDITDNRAGDESPVITNAAAGDNDDALTGYNALLSCATDHFILSPEESTDMSAIDAVTPTHHTLFGDLLSDWRRLHTDPNTLAEISSWTLGPLHDATTPGDLEQLCRSHPDGTLTALLTLHQNEHSHLAGRALLELMAPKLSKIRRYARTGHAHRDRRLAFEDRSAATVAAFLEVIATYRPTNPTGIAGALYLQTLGRITTADISVDDIPLEHDTLRQLEPHHPTLYTATDDGDDHSIDRLLRWAVHTHTIKPLDHRLIQSAYLTPGADMTTVAADHGLTPGALRQRLSRAVRAIRTAVQADTGITPAARPRYATSRAS